MRIANNLPALTAFNALNSTNKSLQKAINSLSTGLRINSAADDAAGFAVSEKMRSQISGLDIALRNSQDGISLLQTAEGALGETNSMLQRMRELCVQASNDTLTSQDRQYIQLEIDELRDQIDRIANTTQFNKKRILDGSSGAIWSSSDAGVKAKIHGGLVSIDEFGQKVNHEGNYRIEVRSDPGEPQIQKFSPFFSATPVEKTVTETIEETFTQTVITTRVEIVNKEEEIIVPIVPAADDSDEAAILEININTGRSTTGATSGKGWNFNASNGTLTITGKGRYKITGTGQATTNHVVVNPGVSADVYLENVNINTAYAAFSMENATANMYLIGTNVLQSGAHRAGVEVRSGATLTINSAAGDGSLDGELRTTGGYHGSGIGGRCLAVYSSDSKQAGNVIIRGGTINAKGGDNAAGIGGGWQADAGQIEIYGGNVTATGGTDMYGSYGGGAGIGSSDHVGDSASATIIIGGGQVTAIGHDGGAGIGGGAYSGAGTIKIAPGLIGTSVIAQGSSFQGQTSEDIGAGVFYKGTYTDYDDTQTVDIPDPPAPAGYEKRKIIVPIEVTIEEVTEQQVTFTEDVKIDKTVVEESTFADFMIQTPAKRGLRGLDISEPFTSAGHETLKIMQGDGKTVEITLYPSDTMSEVAAKINNAIAFDLGQGKYADNLNKFCTIEEIPGSKVPVYTKSYARESNGTLVLDGDGNPIELGGHEVAGYQTASWMFVRSAIPGKEGELYFSGDQDLLNALGLNTIQESSENTLTASVYDAHSGKAIASNVKASGNEFMSLISPEIDIEVDPMSGLSANWNEDTKRFIMAGKGTYTTMLHLKNNGTIFQTGANKGEDFSIQLCDTSSAALNLSGVNAATQKTASRSISIIDRAIREISAQRAKIGSYENALEHTMTSLTTSSTNLTSAESRIRDADMASTMMDFVKLQILNQSGTSMLAQANQLPRSVLSLMQ